MLCVMCKKSSIYQCCESASYCSVECMQSHWFAGHVNALSHVPDSMWTGDYISIFMQTCEWRKLYSEAILTSSHIRFNVFILPLTKTYKPFSSWHPEPQRYVYVHVVNHDGTETLESCSISLQ
jgi:hypothetical protein